MPGTIYYIGQTFSGQTFPDGCMFSMCTFLPPCVFGVGCQFGQCFFIKDTSKPFHQVGMGAIFGNCYIDWTQEAGKSLVGECEIVGLLQGPETRVDPSPVSKGKSFSIKSTGAEVGNNMQSTDFCNNCTPAGGNLLAGGEWDSDIKGDTFGRDDSWEA